MSNELLSAVRLTSVCVVLAAIGWPLAMQSSLPTSGRLAVAWTIGLAALTLLLSLIGFSGVPLGATVIGICAVLLLLLTSRFYGKGSIHVRQAIKPHWSAALGAAIFGLDVWKIFSVPLWSWDHFAIWGAKARLLAATQDLRSLSNTSHPEYPIGFPVSLEILSVGAVPGRFEFRAIHVVFLACLLLITRALVVRITSSAFAANISVAFLALTPLAWDSEAIGLADLPLATFAMSAPALAFGDETGEPFAYGLCLGFLPWIKHEGLPLGLLLLVLLAPFTRPKLLIRTAVAISVAITSLYVTVGTGVSFFAGPWFERVALRFNAPDSVLGELWPYLISPASLGLWVAVPVAFAFAVARRDRRGAALLAVVIAQLSIYCAVYFASFIEPDAHIRSSFHRIASALAPLAIAGIAMTIQGPRPPSPLFEEPDPSEN